MSARDTAKDIMLARLLASCQELLALPEDKDQAERDYPAGTVNGDDAWREYMAHEEHVYAMARVVLDDAAKMLRDGQVSEPASEASVEDLDGNGSLLLIGTRYQLREQFDKHVVDGVTFDRTRSPFYAGEKWAVRCGGSCLTKKGEWEWEPQPSSRSETFYRRCRFKSLKDAFMAWLKSKETK